MGVRLTLSRSVQRAAEAVAAQTMTTGCILVLDVRTAALRACVSVLTKESGESGGFSEKVKAAQAAKIPVFAIKRPLTQRRRRKLPQS